MTKELWLKGVGGLAGVEGMAGPSTAVRVGLRTFAQDDRVGEGWRRTNTGVSPLPLRLCSGSGRNDSVCGNAKEKREDTEILREAQNDGFGGGLGRAYPRG